MDSDEKSPVRIFSFADYERTFGGLSADSPMSFAVFQYFLNGGSDALIVRVHKNAKTAQTPAAPAAALFKAADPGAWGNRVRLRVDHDIDPEIGNVANPANTMFNLKVKDLGTGVTETFLNVSITAGHPRFVSEVLLQSSRLVRGAATFATRPPANGPAQPTATDPFDDPSATALTEGTDGSAVGADEIATGSQPAPRQEGLVRAGESRLVQPAVHPALRSGQGRRQGTWDPAVAYAKERRAMVLVDPPFNSNGWDDISDVTPTRDHRRRHPQRKRRDLLPAHQVRQLAAREPSRGLRALRRGGWCDGPHRRLARRLEVRGRH